jgi:hypothetical protein
MAVTHLHEEPRDRAPAAGDLRRRRRAGERAALARAAIAHVALGVALAGCGQRARATAGDPAVDIAAGLQARSQFGIDHYSVHLAAGITRIGVRAADGFRIASVTTSRLATGTAVVRVEGAGSVTDITGDAATLSIVRDGELRYSLDRAAARAAAGLSELEAAARPMPAEVVPALGLATAVTTDPQLVDYLVPAGATAAYLVTDCPWWVTLATCTGWETGIGDLLCVACQASYLR